jgi:hypothetical protein
VSPHQKKITYLKNNLRFRPILFKDLECIRTWRNSQKIYLRQQKDLSRNNQAKYWNDVILPSFDQLEPNQLLFCLEDFKKNKLLGYGGLVHINWNKKFAESSFLADTCYDNNSEEYQELFTVYLDFLMLCAKELNFLCIYSETYSFRVKHIEILEKYGYIQYGYLNKIKNLDNHSLLHQFFIV